MDNLSHKQKLKKWNEQNSAKNTPFVFENKIIAAKLEGWEMDKMGPGGPFGSDGW